MNVTHLYEFAQGFLGNKTRHALFLRAKRQVNGGRTFKVIEFKPLEKGFCEGLYSEIFGIGEIKDYSNNVL